MVDLFWESRPTSVFGTATSATKTAVRKTNTPAKIGSLKNADCSVDLLFNDQIYCRVPFADARGTPSIAGLPFSLAMLRGLVAPDTPGLGTGVGRDLGVARSLGVGVGLAVAVGEAVGVDVGVIVALAVGVAVAVAVAVAVGVDVAVGVGLAVGVGVGVPVGSLNA